MASLRRRQRSGPASNAPPPWLAAASVLAALTLAPVPVTGVVQRRGAALGRAEAAPPLAAAPRPLQPVPGPQAAEAGAAALLAARSRRFVQAVDAAAETIAAGGVNGIVKVVAGFIIILLGSTIQWFNEERSARAEALLARGREEVAAADADRPCRADRGRLVHVQGIARGAAMVKDPQFRDVALSRILKLQSTVEVFEWVQTTRTWYEGKIRRSQPRFHSEWSTTHQNSKRFHKPSPENPRPPEGLVLGTSTHVCPRAELGSFVLPKAMVGAFQHFELATQRLPARITAGGLTFHVNEQDGYYYARPGIIHGAPDRLFSKHEVGDVRVRFLCVPETEATVVAVQCNQDGEETFVPYRPVALGPCVEDAKAKQYVVEEGYMPFKDLRRETSCCAAGYGMAGCCCCACSTIACICSQEVVTEEIFYISNRLDPVELPFQSFVPRSARRVWGYRCAGLLATLLGVTLLLRPFPQAFRGAACLAAYGASAHLVVAAAVALTLASLFVAAASAFYRPFVTLRWLLVAAACAAAPAIVGGWLHSAEA